MTKKPKENKNYLQYSIGAHIQRVELIKQKLEILEQKREVKVDTHLQEESDDENTINNPNKTEKLLDLHLEFDKIDRENNNELVIKINKSDSSTDTQSTPEDDNPAREEGIKRYISLGKKILKQR